MDVEEGLPKGLSGIPQPHMRLVNFETVNDIYCIQKETAYKKEGLTAYLLCGECEQKLALGEKYARYVLYGQKSKKEHTRATNSKTWYRQRDNGVIQEGLELRWVNYEQFKHFQLGVIWRLCVAKGKFFKAAKTSDIIIENLRKSLHLGIFDERLVPCVMERLHDPTGASFEIIGQPKRNGKIIGIMMGGYNWLYYIEGDAPHQIAIQRNGKLLVKIKDFNEFCKNSSG